MIFAIPGLGRYFVQAVQQLDYTVIMGTTVFYGAFLVFMVIVVDILTASLTLECDSNDLAQAISRRLCASASSVRCRADRPPVALLLGRRLATAKAKHSSSDFSYTS